MKKTIKTAAFIAIALAAIGCAKVEKTGANEANERYFNAWMEVNHPGLKPSGLGIYILENEEGTGAEVKKGGYAIVDYVVTDLEGNISTYTDKYTAQQLGTYDTTAYYGPKVMTTIDNTIQAGLADAIVGMKAGGRKKVIIPSWLMTYKTYDNPADYLKNASTGTSAIYDITIRNYTDSIYKYEINNIAEYFKANSDIFGNMTARDSAKVYGFYYKQLQAPSDTTSFPKDTSIYINYTGRLLNGLVFDTTIEKTAKDNGIWSSSRTYEPTKINWGESYEKITMGSSSSSTISGFALTLWKMRAHEKGIGVFYSPLGYGYNGSGASIPGYSPLIFEIEIVAEPED